MIWIKDWGDVNLCHIMFKEIEWLAMAEIRVTEI